jgi:F420-dependent oxidoreductase-like protein
MKLGFLMEWTQPRMRVQADTIRLVEALGYDSLWSAEAYGSDAFTPLAFAASLTRHIRLGTCIAQLAARTPAAAAMAISTLDQLAGDGRAILGLGVSGPQIVEGWYGQPWGRPYYRVKDYVTIVRKILERKAPVEHAGREISLPYEGEGGRGMGKPLKSILHTNPDIPIWLGTGSESMVKLTAQIADGWQPFGFGPGMMEMYRPWLEAGFARKGARRHSLADFEIQSGCQVVIDDDVRAAIDSLKPMAAFYVGGMGHPDMNFHKQRMIRSGYPEAAERIQELFLAGRRDEAVQAVPDEFIEDGALVGPPQRIRERWPLMRDSGATGITILTEQEEALRLMADLADCRPRA